MRGQSTEVGVPRGRVRRSVLSLALLAASVGVGHASSNPQLPDWVTQAATDAPLKGDWRDAKAVYLLEDTLLTVGPDGRAVERYRAVVKILRIQSRRFRRMRSSSRFTCGALGRMGTAMR